MKPLLFCLLLLATTIQAHDELDYKDASDADTAKVLQDLHLSINELKVMLHNERT